MIHNLARAVLALFLCDAAYGQPPNPPPQFEVASVKPAPPRQPGAPRGTVGCFGGPGSRDPGHFTCANASLSLMVIDAYDVKPYLLRPPVADDDTRFNIVAKVPAGATKEQVAAMLQNLLKERFSLAFHREKTEVLAYALVVAKSGLKMKQSGPQPSAAAITGAASGPEPTKDAEGFRYFARRNGLAMGMANGLTRWVGMDVPIDGAANSVRLTGLLNSLTGSPVIDETGLTGKYDFTLTFKPESNPAGGTTPSQDFLPSSDGGLTVFEAVERQLGLKLERKKIAIDAFVIDHAEKTPVEN